MASPSSFSLFPLMVWLTRTIYCFASVYIWKELFCTSKCCTQILALKAGKGGNLLAQVKRLTVGYWKQDDKHLTVSFSSGKCKKSLFTTSYYLNQLHFTAKQLSWAHIMIEKTMLQLLLIYMSIKKTNILLARAAGNRARSHAHEVN